MNSQDSLKFRQRKLFIMAEKAEIEKKRKIRVGHRSSATKLTNKIKHRLADGSAEEDKRGEKAEIEKKRKIRVGHRSSTTKLTNKIKHRLADGSAEEDKQWIKQLVQTLTEKIDSLKGLDNQIIELIGSLEEEDVEVRIEKEIKDSDQVREELNEIVWRLEEILSYSSVPQPKPTNVPAHSESPTSGSSQQHLVKAKLPKLEVKKFSGRLQDRQEFWDSFQSSID